jgi:hypothetical protein
MLRRALNGCWGSTPKPLPSKLGINPENRPAGHAGVNHQTGLQGASGEVPIGSFDGRGPVKCACRTARVTALHSVRQLALPATSGSTSGPTAPPSACASTPEAGVRDRIEIALQVRAIHHPGHTPPDTGPANDRVFPPTPGSASAFHLPSETRCTGVPSGPGRQVFVRSETWIPPRNPAAPCSPAGRYSSPSPDSLSAFQPPSSDTARV